MMIFPMINNGHVLLQLLRFISFLYIFYTLEALIQRNVPSKVVTCMYILYTYDWWLIELPFQFNVGFLLQISGNLRYMRCKR